MRRTLLTGPAAVLVLLIGSAYAADDFRSGPQKPTIRIASFNPLHCSGPDAGEKGCLV